MKFKACVEYLKQRDRFMILSHKNPDGDTLGSSAALCSALRRIGKEAWLFPNTQVTEKLAPYVEKFFAPDDFQPEITIAVDVAATNLFPPSFKGKVQLCIDHHPSNSGYAEHTLLFGEKAACGEIVVELIRSLCGGMNTEEATLLYIAIATDTGCFQYANVTAATMQATAKLLTAGADNTRINQIFFRKKSEARLRLEGMIFSGMKHYRDGKIAVVSITQEMLKKAGTKESDLDDIAGLAGMSESSMLSITIREQEDGSSRVSVRSGEEVNSSAICAVFGGGGHTMAAGCTINCTPDKAEKLILEVINEVWK